MLPEAGPIPFSPAELSKVKGVPPQTAVAPQPIACARTAWSNPTVLHKKRVALYLSSHFCLGYAPWAVLASA